MTHRPVARIAPAFLLMLSAAWAAPARGGGEPVPDEAAVRRQVDALIAAAPGHRATVGTLQGAMALSISFGAPAWNAGDHDACCRFYVKTGESLCAAFPGVNDATAPARALLGDLKSALGKVRASTDVDDNAWAMRYVFDKTTVAAAGEAAQAVRLLVLGREAFARSRFGDAADAYGDATAALRELDGQPPDQIPPECRFAPVALCDAQFAQKQYAAAAASLAEGLRFLPEWPTVGADVRKRFADPAVYQLLSDDLRDAAAAHPDDPALQFLFGYHLYSTGRKAAAKAFFEKAVKLDPSNAGAKRYLEEYDPSHRPPPRTIEPHPGTGST